MSIAFAMTNLKVLIIDCDMRKGRLHQLFDIPNEKGLSNLLLDDIKNIKKYIIKTKVDNLSIIPIGIIPPNPSELLNSEKFSKLVNNLKNTYDLIIFDVDEAVIVTSYKRTPMEDLVESKKALEASGVKIAGVVINKMENRKGSKYYYDKYYS